MVFLKPHFSIILAFLFATTCVAQNLDEIFDDGNLSGFKVIAEAGYDPIHGNIILNGEYKFAQNFSGN